MSEVKQQSLWGCRWACQRQAWPLLADFFSSPRPFVIDHQEATIKAKDSDPTTILLINVNGKRFVVKRYNIKNVSHKLKIAVRGTHVVRSWRCANHLYYHSDLAIAEPIAYYETRYGPFKGIGYFISAYLQQSVKARDKLVEHESAAIKGFAYVAYSLYQAGVIHRDLQLENIVFIQDEPYVMDFDHVQYFDNRDQTRWHKHIEDIQRLTLCLNDNQKQLFYHYVSQYYHQAPDELANRVRAGFRRVY